jgi:hypothetical protein
MYRYTPKKTILRDMSSARSPGTCWWDTEYHNRQSILTKYNINTYFCDVQLQLNFPEVEYYSIARLEHVPVGGYQFPVVMFNEEFIQ